MPTLTPSIAISGSRFDEEITTFTASACGEMEYSWDFGESSTPAFTAFSTAATNSHIYRTGGRESSFTVTLRTRVRGQNKVYATYASVTIRPKPFLMDFCTNGVVAIDNCGQEANKIADTCGAGTPPAAGMTTYTVQPRITGNYTYTWSVTRPGSGSIVAGNGLSLTVRARDRAVYQCSVSNALGVMVGQSPVFSVERYNSLATTGNNNPCPEYENGSKASR